jgi:uncharacterized protein
MKTHGAWIWYELVTPDVAGAKAFYEAVIPGWAITPGTPETADYGFIANADDGMTGGVLPLTKAMANQGMPPCWLGYIGVDDTDAGVKAIEGAGGKCLMPARDVPMAGRIAMVSDCCGAIFYIMTPTPPQGGGESTAFSTTLPGRCMWNELNAGNADKAVAFYTGLFGWRHDDEPIGAIMNKVPEDPHPHWSHYFSVPSIGVASGAIPAHGGQVINGPMEVPGEDWIVQGIDPQGAFFSLVGSK